MIVAREFTFEAAHQLPAHPGKCRRLHGHGYRLRVSVEAPVDPATGIAVDFQELKRVVEARVLALLDHSYLNEILPVPSAENIAAWVWERLRGAIRVVEVVLYEQADCWVVHRGEGPSASGR